jgi:hypothetical protein
VLVVLAWRHRSTLAPRNLREGLTYLGVFAVLAVLAGASWPLLNKLWCGHFLGDTARVGGMDGYLANAVPRYNGFGNLWKFPFLALIRPFSRNPLAVWSFWEHRYLWWPSLHPIYGHFGWLCSAILCVLPVGVLAHRKAPEGARYRILLTASVLAFFLLSLPQRYRVDGMFCGFPRYLLCLPAIVGLWTVVPAAAHLRDQGRKHVLALVGVALAAYFLGQSWIYLLHDTSKPVEFVLEVAANPDARPDGGASFVLDRLAGPKDAIALDSGFGGMAYPLYGRNLTRPVYYLGTDPSRARIPDAVRWVVIDRAWNVGWSHPGVTTTADFFKPFGRAPTEEDAILFLRLSKDPAFKLAYLDKETDQAIFVRRSTLAP